MKPHPMRFLRVILLGWERTGAASRLQPTPPLRPRAEKQRVWEEEEGEKGKHAIPAAPAPRIPALAALALAGGGGVGEGAQFGVTGQIWRFWGWDGGREGGGPRAHAPAWGGERAQGWFCDAGFQLASAGSLGHGGSCWLSPAALWGTEIGGTGGLVTV